MIPSAPLAALAAPSLGWVFLLLATAGVLGPLCTARFRSPPRWVWGLLLAAALLAFRWPLLWVPHQQNPDESQLIAGAITLRYDPVFWRSVDGGTAGPLDFYPLLPAAWGDGIASYPIARLIGLATVLGTILFAGEALNLLVRLTVARAVVLPAVAFHALTTHPDFTHYSTELMPSLLLAAAGWLIARQVQSPSSARLWLIALLLGAAPWAKPQAMPLAGLLWLLTFAQNFRATPRPSWMPLIAGALLPALACFGLAASTGQIEHLITPLFLNNFYYVRFNAGYFSWAQTTALQWQNVLLDGYLGLWLTGAFAFALFALARAFRAPAAHRRLAALAALLLFAGVICALGPRRPTPHHLHFLMLPVIWATGAALALALRDSPVRPAGARPPPSTLLIVALFLLFALAPQFVWRARQPAGPAAFHHLTAAPAQLQLAALIRRLSAPGEPLAIWGWRSSLYVESGRPQATRQAHTETQIYPGPLQPYYLRRYIEDFQASNPPVFIDAVGPGNFAFTDLRRAHESFSPLRAAITARYTYIATLGGVRLYARNDRLSLLDRVAAP
ncbi:MAG: hypothetical protein H7343_11430 [Undibacterium sp.]|nr:hypothetical protein [Opitutaceae bacterium]